MPYAKEYVKSMKDAVMKLRNKQDAQKLLRAWFRSFTVAVKYAKHKK